LIAGKFFRYKSVLHPQYRTDLTNRILLLPVFIP